VKLHTDFINDEKLGELPRGTRFRFVELLALAGDVNDGGRIPFTPPQIAFKLRDSNREEVAADLADLARVGLLTQEEVGYSITNWSKRQKTDWDSARKNGRERQRKFRAGDKSDTPEIPENDKNTPVTALHCESNAVTNQGDREGEREGDKIGTKLEVSCTAQTAQKTTTDHHAFEPPPSVSAKIPPEFASSATASMDLPASFKAQKSVRKVKSEARAAQNATRPRYLDYPAVAAVAKGWDKFFTASFAEWLQTNLAYPLQEGRVTVELLETRAREWASKYGTFQRENANLIAVLLNGWDAKSSPDKPLFGKPAVVGSTGDDFERVKAILEARARGER